MSSDYRVMEGFAHSEEPPWWHVALAERVTRLEQSPTRTDVAVLTAQLEHLEEQLKTLRNTIFGAAPLLGALAAYLTNLAT